MLDRKKKYGWVYFITAAAGVATAAHAAVTDGYVWSSRDIGARVTNIAVGDLDGDGDDDAVLISRTGASYVIAEQTSGDSYAEPSGSGGSLTDGSDDILPDDVELADLNKDGDLDMVICGALDTSPREAVVQIFTGDGNFGFTLWQTRTFSELGATGVDIGDTDDDGDLDIAVSLGSLKEGTIPITYTNGGFEVLENTYPTYSTVFPSSFSHNTTFGEGLVWDIEFADTDDDGDLDIALTRSQDSSSMLMPAMDIWEATGSFSFSLASSTTIDDLAYDLEVADLDDNGDVDFVATTAEPTNGPVPVTNDNIWVIEGDGANGTSGTDTYDVSDRDVLITYVEIGDINDDGDLDIIGVGSEDKPGLLGGFVQLNGDGSLGFSVAAVRSISDRPADVKFTHLYGTSAPMDVVIASRDAESIIGVRTESGTGFEVVSQLDTVTASGDGVFPYAIAHGDFDDDGDEDLAVASVPGNNDGVLSIFLNDGSGGFSSPQEITTFTTFGAAEMIAADLDDDDDLDLAFTDPSLDYVVWTLNNGSGTFGTPSRVATSSTPWGLAADDFDDDGDVDLITAAAGTDEVEIYENNGSASFSYDSSVTFSFDPLTVIVVDLNGDGDNDLVAGDSSASSSELGVALRTGSGTYGTPSDTSVNGQVFKILADDLDGDSDQDVFIITRTGSGVSAAGELTGLLGNGSGGFASTQTASLGTSVPIGMDIADFDNDGDDEVVISDSRTGVFAMFRSTFISPPLGQPYWDWQIVRNRYASGGDPGQVAFVDLNADCAPDIVCPTRYQDYVYLHFNRRDDLFSCGGSLTEDPDSTFEALEMMLDQFGEESTLDQDGDGVITESDLELLVGSSR